MEIHTQKGERQLPMVHLALAPDTSEQIAQIRCIYRDQGRKFTSLTQVVRDAIFHFYTHLLTFNSVASDWEDFKK